MSRKHGIAEADAHSDDHPAPAGRAARAASRVAARFASAPSYSQMLAEEARTAVRAAQAARKAAEQAHVAAQMVLAGLEAAALPKPLPDAGSIDAEIATAPSQADSDPFAAMRLQPLEEPARNSDEAAEFGSAAAPRFLPANLIQFPREMVASRRVRPRRVEGPLAALESGAQLSIFEVDPAAVSTRPAPAIAEVQAEPEWMRPEWAAACFELQTAETPAGVPMARVAEPRMVGLAPFARRLLAAAVDGALILTASLGLLALSERSGLLLHSPRAFSLAASLVLLLVCAVYQALFAAFAKATPGMAYAGSGFCTFEGCVAQREQRFRRLLALPLSVLPLGLGLAWSLFDEDRLTWHDRLSGTYPRLR